MWRPIKTAPKDRLILLAQPPFESAEHDWLVIQGRWIAPEVPHQNEIIAAFNERREVRLGDCGRWLSYYPAFYSGDPIHQRTLNVGVVVVYPSHWQDLPAPPKGRYKRPIA